MSCGINVLSGYNNTKFSSALSPRKDNVNSVPIEWKIWSNIDIIRPLDISTSNSKITDTRIAAITRESGK